MPESNLRCSLKDNTRKEGKMARIFKVLASIVAWILFILGCFGIVGALTAHFAAGEPWEPLGAWAMTLAYLVSSVVVMKLWKMLE
jgi:hypothetical protein